jgi:hypothetical protein
MCVFRPTTFLDEYTEGPQMSANHRSNSRRVRRITMIFAILLASLSTGLAGMPAAYAANDADPCISPTGTNINAFYGVSVAVIAPFCTQIEVGQQFAVTSLWVMSPTFKHVTKSFVPAGGTPTEDFVAKFAGATYVFDAGTEQESAHFLANGPGLATGFLANGLAYANTITMGTFRPLSPGTHTIQIFFSFEAMHCDGFGKVIGENCLGPGSVLFDSWTFEVIA